MTEFNPADQKVEFQKKGAVGDKVTVNVTSTEGGKAEVRESNVFVSTLTVSEKVNMHCCWMSDRKWPEAIIWKLMERKC